MKTIALLLVTIVVTGACSHPPPPTTTTTTEDYDTFLLRMRLLQPAHPLPDPIIVVLL
jgi:hypothetical protein